MKNDNWELKECADLNRMLRVRNDLENFDKKKQFDTLLTITHKYSTSDDVLFPEPITLAFFADFEETKMNQLEQEGSLVFVASDIYAGLLEIHCYVKDSQKSIYDVINHVKARPEFHIEFTLTTDPKWEIFEKLS